MIKSFDKIIASKMVKGLTKESDKITEIGNVLVAMGKSRTERIWLLSHDEDFIPDVLSCYKNQKVEIMRFRRRLQVNLLEQKRSRRQSVQNQIRWLEGKQLESSKAGDKWQVDQDEKQIRRLKEELWRTK